MNNVPRVWQGSFHLEMRKTLDRATRSLTIIACFKMYRTAIVFTPLKPLTLLYIVQASKKKNNFRPILCLTCGLTHSSTTERSDFADYL